MLTSVNYQKYESQVRALLYILKQNGLDHKIIAEYIAGNQENFKQVCVQIFGENFNNYFNSISSRDNEKTEQMVIELITNYIKGNGLNISNYWGNNSNQLAQDNLYFKGSPTLSRAVVNCGIESFKPEEQNFYKYFESSVKIANDTYICAGTTVTKNSESGDFVIGRVNAETKPNYSYYLKTKIKK